MPISVRCPNCDGQFKAPDEYLGRRAKCPKCKSAITVIDNSPPPDETTKRFPIILVGLLSLLLGFAAGAGFVHVLNSSEVSEARSKIADLQSESDSTKQKLADASVIESELRALLADFEGKAEERIVPISETATQEQMNELGGSSSSDSLLNVSAKEVTEKLSQLYTIKPLNESESTVTFAIGFDTVVELNGPRSNLRKIVILGPVTDQNATDMGRAFGIIRAMVGLDDEWHERWFSRAMSKIDVGLRISGEHNGKAISIETIDFGKDKLLMLTIEAER